MRLSETVDPASTAEYMHSATDFSVGLDTIEKNAPSTIGTRQTKPRDSSARTIRSDGRENQTFSFHTKGKAIAHLDSFLGSLCSARLLVWRMRSVDSDTAMRVLGALRSFRGRGFFGISVLVFVVCFLSYQKDGKRIEKKVQRKRKGEGAGRGAKDGKRVEGKKKGRSKAQRIVCRRGIRRRARQHGRPTVGNTRRRGV